MFLKLRILINARILCSGSFYIYKDDAKKINLTIDSDVTDKHYELCSKVKITLSI